MRRYCKLFVGALLLGMLALLHSTNNPRAAYTEEIRQTIYLPNVSKYCYPSSLPAGAIDGQPLPIFCVINNSGPSTAQAGANFWIDDFDHKLEFANFDGTPYKIFEKVGFVYKTVHWRHADHWMVDVASSVPQNPPSWVQGGAHMRPQNSFRFENGRLIIEADVGAGLKAYGDNAWPELVITTGDHPTPFGGLYAYDSFPEDWTLGCRLHSSRYPVCALKADNGHIAKGKLSTRIWEMSSHQIVGKTSFGGYPLEGRENYWRVCKSTESDMLCRDRFRLELTRTSLTLFVNGEKYFQQTGIPPLPNELFNEDVFAYFSSMVVAHQAEALRFHWDRLSINPGSGPSTAPGFQAPKGKNPTLAREDK